MPQPKDKDWLNGYKNKTPIYAVYKRPTSECKLVQPLWRTVWRFLKKLEIELPYDPEIPLLGIHTKETRTERHVYLSVHRSTVYNSQDMEAT